MQVFKQLFWQPSKQQSPNGFWESLVGQSTSWVPVKNKKISLISSSWLNTGTPKVHEYTQSPFIRTSAKFLVKFKTQAMGGSNLTRLTWLIHTSVLPSNWNPGKIFPLKKIFLIFLHGGRWLFLLLNLWFLSKLVYKMN